jgi:hypothetical protein
VRIPFISPISPDFVGTYACPSTGTSVPPDPVPLSGYISPDFLPDALYGPVSVSPAF